MKIAIKEADETLYWLLICERSESYPKNSSLRLLVEELIRIISKIILSSKQKSSGLAGV
jgi:four helix bundle protein